MAGLAISLRKAVRLLSGSPELQARRRRFTPFVRRWRAEA